MTAHTLVAHGMTAGPFQLPLKDWLLYAFALLCPFFMFSIAFSRDSAPFWVVILMAVLMLAEFLRSGGGFWVDRSYLYLLALFAVYIAGTLVVFLREDGSTWLGRSPLERAVTTDLRMLYVVVAFIAFSNMLAGAPDEVFENVFKIQIAVGALLALFGILQFVAFTFFHSTALSEIEPTNETYSLQSALIRLDRSRVFRSNAIFSEPSWFGFFLLPLMVKVLVARVKGIVIGSRPIHLALIGVFALAIFFNFSLTAFLTAFLLSVMYVANTAWKRPGITALAVLMIVAVIAGVLVSPLGEPLLYRLERVLELRDPSTIDRVVRVYTSIRLFLDNAWIGVGPGGYAFWYPRLGGLDFKVMASPLNTWLFILTDVGIVGFVPFVVFLWSILRRSVRWMKSSPLLSVYFWSTVTLLILLTTLDNWYGEMLWFELAVLLALTSKRTEARPGRVPRTA
jgi:O-antigen ligase